MLLAINPSHGWKCVATFKIIGNAPSLDAALGAIQHRYRIEPAQEASAGYSCFDVVVNFSFGERRAWQAAHAVLTALQDFANSGLVKGYRLVTGQFYFTSDTDASLVRIATTEDQQEPLIGEVTCA